MSSSEEISRRDFLKRSGVLLTAASTLPLFAPSVGAASGRKSVVRLASRSPGKLTPGLVNSDASTVLNTVVYDWMFRLKHVGDKWNSNQKNKLVPSLVKEYEHSDDATRWTFKVREGVKFHHGTELTAKDVVYTFNYHLDPDISSVFKTNIKHINRIEQDDKYTATFHLSQPDPDLPKQMIDQNAMIIAHDYDYQKFGETEPSGTGAFQVEKFRPNEKITLKKNPDYFLSGVPFVDRLEYVISPDRASQVMLLQAGDVDGVPHLSPYYAQELENKKDIRVLSIGSSAQTPISMRVDRPPFDDNRVRLAMKYCVDRQLMLDQTIYGKGSIGHDHPISSVFQWYKDLGTRQRDVEKAKELLAKAGHGNGLDVKLYYANNISPISEVVMNFQQMAKPCGINVELMGSSRNVYLSKYWRNVDLMCTKWAHRETPINLLKVAYKSNGPWNEGHFKSDQLDNLIDKAASEINHEKRQEYFTSIQKLLREEGPSIIPIFTGYNAGVKTRIKDYWMARNDMPDIRFVKINK
ncbi:MAG: ABC transporter substrate-binding protein [Candidatus Acetothermia bacterium]